MNNYCRELNFTPELYPKLDFSKYNTNGYDWSTFHKTPSPSELNNNHLFAKGVRALKFDSKKSLDIDSLHEYKIAKLYLGKNR